MHITFFKKTYYWLNLKDDVEEYMKTRSTFQQNQTFNKKQIGLLQLLLIFEGPCKSVSMDFMVNLLPSKGFDAIMVVVDRFNKMAHFVPTKEVPRPKRQEGCSSRMCSSIMASSRTLCRIKTQSSQASFGKLCGNAYGLEAQNEHLISTQMDG
jgi:hypothetical protein